MKHFYTIIILLTFLGNVTGQNITISDDGSHTADASAMLDVYSQSKGMLVPKLTATQRLAISTPADGLLVYDTDSANFFFYSSGSWHPVSGAQYFQTNGDSVYITGNAMRLGVGTKSPKGRMVIVGASGAPADEPLFEVKNSQGKSLFAVYENEVKVNFVEGTKGVKGGFAIGGLAPGKTTPTEYMRITPDSVRVYVKPDAAKGIKGGFAIGGLSPGKTTTGNILQVSPGNVQVMIDTALAKGYKGGFAVGGLAPGKGDTINYMKINPGTVNIKIDDSPSKGVKGGFAIGGLSPGKVGSPSSDFFNIGGGTTVDVVNPSQPSILWYPQKEAFLTGRVLIESPDSVGTNSMATGFESKAIGDFSQALGYQSRAKGINSTAIGYLANAEGVNSYAFGSNVMATDSNAYAFGKNSASLAKGAFVFGTNDTASGISSMAIGYNTVASGLGSFAMGANTLSSDTLSVAMGYKTISDGGSAVAMGESTHASGYSSLALGYKTTASGDNSTSMGTSTIASGSASIAMGHNSIASALHCIAMGDSSVAKNDDAVAMGYHTTSSGLFSTSMGHLTTASGDASFASGGETSATGQAAIAMGYQTNAVGIASLALGSSTTANGGASVAVGSNTVADGDASVAFGAYTNATASSSFVLGTYNEAFSSVNSVDPSSDLFVIGNGSPLSRHNALTVLKNGNVGINTNTPDMLLTVDGSIRVTGDIYYGIGTDKYTKPDYVFENNYSKKFNILEIESFIIKNKHLPWVTAAKDEKKGVNITKMTFESLEAIENQQLQIISLKKELVKQDIKYKELQKENKELLNRIKRLEEIILK